MSDRPSQGQIELLRKDRRQASKQLRERQQAQGLKAAANPTQLQEPIHQRAGRAGSTAGSY